MITGEIKNSIDSIGYTFRTAVATNSLTNLKATLQFNICFHNR